MDAIVAPRDPRRPFPVSMRQADRLRLLLLLGVLGDKTSLELVGSLGAEVVAASGHVGSVGVVGRVERGEEGEHFGRVAAAAEDDEEVCGGAAFAGCGTPAVEGGEDVDEAELWGLVSLGSGWWVLVTYGCCG